MQGLDLWGQHLLRAAVVDHIVGCNQALLTAGLRGEDGPHLVFTQAGSLHDARHLHRRIAIDDEDAIAAIAVAAGLDQQGHGEDDVGGLRRVAQPVALCANQGMQDGFEGPARGWIGEDPLPHRRSVERAVGAQDAIAETLAQSRDGDAPWAGDGMRDGIGIDEGRTARDEEIGNRALATADAAG